MYTLQIPNGFFHLWYSYLKSRDIDGFAFPFSAVQKQQLSYILAQPINAQTSYVLFIDLIQQTEQQLNCPHLIFDMVQHIQPEHFGILGYIASKSSSVAEALHFVLGFNRLVIDGQESVPMHLSQIELGIHLHWGLSHRGHVLINELSEFDSSFKKVIEAERIKRCNILLQQNICLSEIALALGYSDQSALARADKAATGHTLFTRRQQFKLKE